MADEISGQELADWQRVMYELKLAVNANTNAQREQSVALEKLRNEIATTYVRQDVLTPTLKALEDDIKSHSEWITWATRIVLALVIAAVVGLAITQGGGAPT